MKNIAIVCGGYSGEFEISMQSAALVKKSLNKQKYNGFLILIEKEEWHYLANDGSKSVVNKSDFTVSHNNSIIRFDGVFNAIHGTPGEDGKLLGYFDMLQIPYTSSSADTSALTFNKFHCNAFVSSYGVNIAKSLSFSRSESIDNKFIIEKLGLPVFVKPVRSGSSVGVTKVKNIEQLSEALSIAFKVDSRILIEEFIDGREIDCGVLKDGKQLVVLPLTEIISKNEFFDFEAKYDSRLADEICPAENMPEEVEDDIKALSSFLFNQLDCSGFVRFDYILTNDNLYFIEVNSVPGISETSIMPKMAKAYGYSLEEFFDIIVDAMFTN